MFLKPEQIVPFIYYVYITAITPGPANLCSLGTAIQYGRKVAMRQWFGILSGYAIVSTGSALICYFLGTALNDKIKYLSFVGAALQRFFVNYTKAVNIAMAVSLILCAVSLVIF